MGLFFLAPLAHSEQDLGQADAQKLNAQLNHTASDKSLQNSTVYAMRALMDLAHTNIPSAVNNGFSAYGRYRNSEGLDRLTDANIHSANSMASIGSDPVVTGKTGPTNTTFRRLDTSFLRQGEAAKVAAEFEKQTGMGRDEFLQQLSTVSEQKIRSSDPMLFDKALSRLESFVSKIPNQQFRKSVEKNIALVPDTMRKGLVAQAVSKFAGLFAGSAPASGVSDPAGAKVAAAGADSGASAPAAASPESAKEIPEPTNGREPAALVSAATGQSAGTRNDKNPLDGVVQAALESSNQAGDLTIFQQVSRRIRALSPGLTKGLN